MHTPFDGTDRELASRAGRASGAARRRRRDMRAELELLLSSRVKDAGGKTCTRQAVMLANIVERAMHGDIRAAIFIRDTLEGRPATRVEPAQAAEPMDVRIVLVGPDGKVEPLNPE